jgi:SAM-dependent methyltransferase
LNSRPAPAKKYIEIVEHYESCLKKHGDTHLGVDWPKAEDAETRYRVMLGVIRGAGASVATLLDFGCGASHLYEYIIAKHVQGIDYTGLDLSPKFVELCRKKFPQNNYICADILETPEAVPCFDYIVINGVFTEKRGLTFEEMLGYFESTVRVLFAKAERGIAFNVMSKHVDWERNDLFHLPFDTLAQFLRRDVSRHFVIRNDYGLYEYTTYVYREKEQEWRT